MRLNTDGELEWSGEHLAKDHFELCFLQFWQLKLSTGSKSDFKGVLFTW